MDGIIQSKGMEDIFDQVVRKVTKQTGGISLHQGRLSPVGKVCTVYVIFEKGFRMGIMLCAEEAFFTRLTQHMTQETKNTFQDIEDFSREYFNVLCGEISYRLFQTSNIASRFGIPDFRYGFYKPENYKECFSVGYISDEGENVELTMIRHESLM